MITTEQIQSFINWQQEKPGTRKVEIKIGERGFKDVLNPETGFMDKVQYTILVSDNLPSFTCQYVNDVSEIDLIGQRIKQLEKQIAELEQLERGV